MRVPTYVVTVFVLASCATTSISAIRNKEVEPVTFTKIMVFAPFDDIGWRQKTEASFVSEMQRKDIFAKEVPPRNPYYKDNVKEYYSDTSTYGVPSIDIIPPFRDYAPEDLQARYAEANVDGILVVALDDFWTTDFQIFQYYSYTRTVIGYTLSKPSFKFDIRLIDVASGEIMWMATTVTAGNIFADRGELLKSLAHSVIGELDKESFVIKEVKHY